MSGLQFVHGLMPCPDRYPRPQWEEIARAAANLTAFAERARRGATRALQGLAATDGLGPHVILVFETQAEYYEYIAPFYADGGRYAASAGVHVNPGYGRAWWDSRSVQEYWSGLAFHRPDKLSELSYELAWVTVRSLAEDYPLFQRFAAEAAFEDAGQSASHKHFGHGLGKHFEALLGEGDWEPAPGRWDYPE